MDVGIFSIFKRKHDRSAMSAAQEDAIRIERVGEPTRQDSEAERQRQRAIARATTQKIDAIESAMAFDIFNSPEAPVTGRTLPAPGMPITDSNTLHPTLPMLELASTELQEDQCALDPALIDQSAPLIEDIAVTFANADIAGAEQMLRAALADTGRDNRALWSMLFDLLQVCHAREQFDDLSIDYASRFETSPPSWRVIASEHGVDGEVHT